MEPRAQYFIKISELLTENFLSSFTKGFCITPFRFRNNEAQWASGLFLLYDVKAEGAFSRRKKNRHIRVLKINVQALRQIDGINHLTMSYRCYYATI